MAKVKKKFLPNMVTLSCDLEAKMYIVKPEVYSQFMNEDAVPKQTFPFTQETQFQTFFQAKKYADEMAKKCNLQFITYSRGPWSQDSDTLKRDHAKIMGPMEDV